MNKNKICGIYKITNVINNNSYIGQSVDIEHRYKNHMKKAFLTDNNPEYNKALYRAIRKYSIDNFTLTILEEVSDISKLDEREIYWIEYFDTYKHGYNATPGGEGVKNNQGENHPNHLITELDVIDIRTRWAAQQESTREIYVDYKDIISKSGFKKIYTWQTWKSILPELNTEDNRNWHKNNVSNYACHNEDNPRHKLTAKQVIEIRKRHSNGESAESIYQDFKFTTITFRSFLNTMYGYTYKIN